MFAKFDALDVGESFVLINDHDPVPLHGQMEEMHPHQLTWEDIKGGRNSLAFGLAVWHRCADPKRHPASHTGAVENPANALSKKASSVRHRRPC